MNTHSTHGPAHYTREPPPALPATRLAINLSRPAISRTTARTTVEKEYILGNLKDNKPSPGGTPFPPGGRNTTRNTSKPACAASFPCDLKFISRLYTPVCVQTPITARRAEGPFLVLVAGSGAGYAKRLDACVWCQIFTFPKQTRCVPVPGCAPPTSRGNRVLMSCWSTPSPSLHPVFCPPADRFLAESCCVGTNKANRTKHARRREQNRSLNTMLKMPDCQTWIGNGVIPIYEYFLLNRNAI